jgi:ribosome recycling factor
MDKSLRGLRADLQKVRTGRASTALLDGVQVEYYGTPTPINQLANMSTPDPRLIVISPYDKSSISAIEKAVLSANLGLTPSNDGKVVRIPIPPLTEERRKDLVKRLHVAAEGHRVAVRNIRRDGNDAVKKLLKDKKVTEDDEKRAHDEIQKMTDSYMQKIDLAAKTKEKDILEIK